MSKTSWILLALLFVFVIEPSWASQTTGGGLPYEAGLEKLKNSITGPFAFTASIMGIVGAGAALIFGGEINGFLKALIFIVLVLSLIVAAPNVISIITGKGALIGDMSVAAVGVAS